MSNPVEVVVVGAGLAGLVAARQLVASGRSVAVLEARDRVGGRILNHDLDTGKVVEMGGEFVGPTQDRIAALIQTLGIETFPTYNDGKNILYLAGRKSYYTGAIPRLNPFVLLDILQAQIRFGRMAKRVPLEAPWEAPPAHDWDGQTLESWVRRTLRTARGRDFFRIFTEAVFAAEAADVSLLHALFYTRSGTDFDTLINVANGAQQDRIVGGSQVICLRLAETLGACVHLNTPVRRIEQHAGGVRVHADMAVFDAARVIVTMPPALAARIAYDPPLPADRDQLTQRVPAGSVIKCMAIWDRPFWRDEGLTGQVASDVGPAKITFDNSPPDGVPGVLLAFVEGGDARKLSRLSTHERRQAVLQCLARYFGDRALAPREYVDKDWSADEWTRGCYGAHFPPGVWTAYGPALSRPIGRVHWAGAETATVWNGYMDGAVRSGERAAAEVLAD